MIPVEAMAAVGLLLKSYWNPHYPLFNLMDQLDTISMLTQGDYPVLITTKTKPENGEGQNGQQNQSQNQSQSQPSQSQASGTITLHTAALPSLMSSGSGGGNQNPEQPRHTFGLNCFVDSCHGVCQFLSEHPERSWTGHTHHGTTGTQTDQRGVGRSRLVGIPSILVRRFDLMSCGFGSGSSSLNALPAESLPISQLLPISHAHIDPPELAGTLEDSSDTHGAEWDVDPDMDIEPYEE